MSRRTSRTHGRTCRLLGCGLPIPGDRRECRAGAGCKRVKGIVACQDCERVFRSTQALGGHRRARDGKPAGCPLHRPLALQLEAEEKAAAAAAAMADDVLYRTLAGELARKRGDAARCPKSVFCSRGAHTGRCNMLNLLTDAERPTYKRAAGRGASKNLYSKKATKLARARLNELRRRGVVPLATPPAGARGAGAGTGNINVKQLKRELRKHGLPTTSGLRKDLVARLEAGRHVHRTIIHFVSPFPPVLPFS